jgi:hypothetical protein
MGVVGWGEPWRYLGTGAGAREQAPAAAGRLGWAGHPPILARPNLPVTVKVPDS